MKFRKFRWYFFVGLILLGFSCQTPQSPVPHIEKGVLDLRKRDFREGELYLDGEWEFYWKQLYSAEYLQKSSPKPDYLQVPDIWNRFNKGKSNWEAGDGYGTYHLTVLLKNKEKELGLFVPIVSTAMEIWADENLVCKIGVVGITEKTSVPAYYPQTILLHPQSDTLHLILKISNFHYRKGGAWDSFLIGSKTDIERFFTFTIIRDFFLIGGLLLIGLYYLTTFFIIVKDFSTLCFSLFCLLTSIRLLFSDIFQINLLADWDWTWMVRIELMSFYLAVVAFTGFLRFAFPKETPAYFFYGVLATGLVFSGVILCSSVKFFSFTVVPYEIFAVLCCVWATYIFFRIWQHKQEGGLLFLIGFLILFVTFVNDILYLNNILLTGKWLYAGIFVFTLFLAVTLARKLSLAFIKLAETNEALTGKNLEIEEKNEELTKLNQELDAFVYRTSHDLRSPMNSVMGLLEIAKYESNPEVLKEYFEMGIKVLKRMDNLISDTINYARNSRVEIQYEKINFPQVIEEIFANFAFLENSAGIEKKYSVSLESDFCSDSSLIAFILNNLVSNAIKYHDLAKESPFIHVHITEFGNQVAIAVEDNGNGISQEHLDKIFQMFYRAASNFKGAGLGLYIVKETIIKLKGKIEVSSVVGEGTTFRVLLHRN